MKHIEVSGRPLLHADEYYQPADGEIIKLSFRDSSMCVKAVRKRASCCELCVFNGSLCTPIPLECTHHYYIDLNSILENL